MKYIIKCILLLLPVVASASELTITNTFVSGTPALASQVNKNFQDVKAAVDDNNARINALESKSTYYISVAPTAFRISETNSNCNTAAGSANFFIVSGSDCIIPATPAFTRLYVPVSLPHGATVTNLNCRVTDSTVDADVQFFISSTNLNTLSITTHISTLSASSGVGLETLTSGTVSHTVDNSANTYLLRANILLYNGVTDHTSIYPNLAVHGCVITYTM